MIVLSVEEGVFSFNDIVTEDFDNEKSKFNSRNANFA